MSNGRAWGVFVRFADEKRGAWLMSSGYTTRARIRASLNWGEAGRATCERVAREIMAETPGVALAEARMV